MRKERFRGEGLKGEVLRPVKGGWKVPLPTLDLMSDLDVTWRAGGEWRTLRDVDGEEAWEGRACAF